MNLHEAELWTLQVMRDEGLIGEGGGGWTFRFDDTRRRFGCCRYDRKEITLSRHLVQLNGEREVLNTIRHEVAHAICGKEAGHGPVWSKVCVALGGDGKRCYGADVKQPPRTVRLTADMMLPTLPTPSQRGTR